MLENVGGQCVARDFEVCTGGGLAVDPRTDVSFKGCGTRKGGADGEAGEEADVEVDGGGSGAARAWGLEVWCWS